MLVSMVVRVIFKVWGASFCVVSGLVKVVTKMLVWVLMGFFWCRGVWLVCFGVWCVRFSK